MGFDRGFISGYFVTNQERMEVVLENAYVLLTDKRITVSKTRFTSYTRINIKNKPAFINY